MFNLNRIDSRRISENPNAIKLLIKHLDKVDWYEASSNENVGMLLKKLKPHDLKQVLMKELNWDTISSNNNIFPFLSKIINGDNRLRSYFCDKLYWDEVCETKNGFIFLREMTENFTKNLRYISWKGLSSNPYAISLLLENESKIDWNQFCRNTHPKAIQLISQNMDKINSDFRWYNLSCNFNAMDILKQNQEHINWIQFSYNPSILEIDTEKYNKMKSECVDFIYNL
jgi:hypothetical protein